ncbi:fasciclin [Clostridium taeniosporum]|uniref:Fasciclin n=2 Tax=Clostridium taeniosporum TaxID=394958 RepID=A0A1D7XNS9_9CLOT|nr:fasciclin [Clostridium taeniosporum]
MGDEKASKDIVDIAISDGRFKTLVTALKSAELVDALKGEGPFTVFAPTDDAFAKLPKEKLDELLKPENKKALVDILKYHVVPSKVSSKDVIKLDGKEITMANGKKAKIKVKDGSVYINDVKVTTTDIMGKNGVIHVIDAVLIP